MSEIPPSGWASGAGLTHHGYGDFLPPPPYPYPCAACVSASAPQGFNGQLNYFLFGHPQPACIPSAPAPVPAPPPFPCHGTCCTGIQNPVPLYQGPYPAPGGPAPVKGPPNVPGATILQPSGPYITFIVIHKGLKVWKPGQGHGFPFELKQIETSTTVRSLIERLGGDKGHKITEACERGDGIWTKGLTIMYKHLYAKKTLAEVGWSEQRGGPEQPPLVVVLLKDKGGGDVEN